MKVITVLNEKGGVGKTTLAVHLAAGLAIEGKRVLLLDSDPQANATSEVRGKKTGGLFHICVEEAEWRDELVKIPTPVFAGQYPPEGTLALLPNNVTSSAIPMTTNDQTVLRRRLGELEPYFDCVVIDTSPMPSMLHVRIYVATDYVIYPTGADSLSIEGLAETEKRLKETNPLREARGWNPIELLGIVPVMTQPHTHAHSFGLSKILEHYKNRVWNSIPMRTVWRERSFSKVSLFAYAHKIRADDSSSQAAVTECWAFVDRVYRGVWGHV